MSDVKFSSLITASYLHGNDYIAIIRSGSSTNPTSSTPPNNYIVQAKNFTASYAVSSSYSISSSRAATAGYAPTNVDISCSAIRAADISASGYVSASTIRATTSMTSPIGNFTNFTASNITASGYVSASIVVASTSMTSPIGNFTNFTASNITASGYVSASIVVASTSMTSPIGNFTNFTASNITASGYVSASIVVASTSMTSPIGNFTNFTASNITASGYISASSVRAVDFYGTASRAITASYALRSGDDPDSLTQYTSSGIHTFQGLGNTFYKVYIKGAGGGSSQSRRYGDDGKTYGGSGGDGGGAEGFILTGGDGILRITVGEGGVGGTSGVAGGPSMVEGEPSPFSSIVALGGAGAPVVTGGGDDITAYGLNGADGSVVASTKFILVQSNVDLLPTFGQGGTTVAPTNWGLVSSDTRPGGSGAVFIASL